VCIYLCIISECLENKKGKKHINDEYFEQQNIDGKQRVIIVVFLSEIVNDDVQCSIINETQVEKKDGIIILEYMI